MTIQTQDEAASLARVTYFRSTPEMIEEKARAQAKADRSDPFTYARVRAHFLNGVVLEPSDYNVEWGKERREAVLDGRKAEFVVTVPRNVKRP